MPQLEPNLPARLHDDPWLKPFFPALDERKERILDTWKTLSGLLDWHEFFGLHRMEDGTWCFREWLPNVKSVSLIGTFNGWRLDVPYPLVHTRDGIWEGLFPADAFHHGDAYGMHVEWDGGNGYRLPSCTTMVTREHCDFAPYGMAFNAMVWEPPQGPYRWKHHSPAPADPIIYESHVGMATAQEKVGTFAEYTRDILPRIAAGGYNTVQLMGIQQHPYYGSFGYHVSNFFSVCDLFGTPDDFKELVDTAHGLGLRVIMDLVHSHAVKNETEGLSRINGTDFLYFHSGQRGYHPAWDSRCFDYGKTEVQRFLLSNCIFWLKEYHIDGFRFDGVTSMLYHDHGLNRIFTQYGDYFSENTDADAVTYLGLANLAIHEHFPLAQTIAEDVSGMPGLCAPVSEGGMGFDYRLAMGITDLWFKLTDGIPDECWPLWTLWHELLNHREDERSISYVECHDQSLVGGKSFLFTLIDAEIYTQMHTSSQSLVIDRGIALHKLARLLTLATANHGYLNFMGNEFGHPEWIDFPREGNGWSYAHARRLWHLRDDAALRFKGLGDFDCAMLALIRQNPRFFDCRPQLLRCDDNLKLLVFERAGLFFAFNFHPVSAQPELPVTTGKGTFSPALDTDSTAFGGQGLIGSAWSAPAVKTDDSFGITVNLPPRTALVLKKH